MDRAEQLGRERIPVLLLRFSIPAIVGMLVQALYNVVDRIFVGHGVGAHGIAGLTVVFPIMLVIMAFSMLIGLGATALISIKLGRRESARSGTDCGYSGSDDGLDFRSHVYPRAHLP